MVRGEVRCTTREDTVTDGRMVTRELAEWVAGLRFDDLPEPVAEEAARSFADFLGECLFVGATKPWGRSIAEFCGGEGGGQPEATIIASGQKTLSSRAALANGTMALGFEYADFAAGSRAYPFAVTGPLALAEARHRSGKELALAIVIGYEVMRPRDHATIRPTAGSGFYVPALYGTFGSAAGCARRARADAAPHELRARPGRRLHRWHVPGPRGGRLAAVAQRWHGQRARRDGALSWPRRASGRPNSGWKGCRDSPACTADGRLDAAVLLDDLGESFVITDRWVKGYPMNVTLHAPVEALLKIMREHELRHTDIERDRCRRGRRSSPSSPSTRSRRSSPPRPACRSPCRWPLCTARSASTSSPTRRWATRWSRG